MKQTRSKFSTWEDAVFWLKEQPDKSDLVRDAYYDDPLESAANRYLRSEEWSSVKTYLGKSKGKALDVGAGRGIASYALAREGFEVIALEPDASDLVGAGAIRGLAKSSRLDIRVVQEFSESLPFEDGVFDVVFARAVLHHTGDLKAACCEFKRVLKPGGKLLAVREHVISRKEHLEEFLQGHPLHNLYGGENAFLLDEYKDALLSAGFQICCVLKPLESVINFAPHNESMLKDEVVRRLEMPNFMKSPCRTMLNIPGAWGFAKRLIALLDHRPGRLYSFICKRVT